MSRRWLIAVNILGRKQGGIFVSISCRGREEYLWVFPVEGVRNICQYLRRDEYLSVFPVEGLRNICQYFLWRAWGISVNISCREREEHMSVFHVEGEEYLSIFPVDGVRNICQFFTSNWGISVSISCWGPEEYLSVFPVEGLSNICQYFVKGQRGESVNMSFRG